VAARTHILIIEDNAKDLEMMRNLLEAFNYRTSVAWDCEGAIQAARAPRPDLILCDARAPSINGYEVARRIRADPELALIPVIAVTAPAMVGDSDKVLAAGFSGCLVKPIDPETFVAQVKAFLRAGPRSATSRTPAAG
jgi:two-component system, cell cycle response regulator